MTEGEPGYVGGYGSPYAKVMIVGEAPGEQEALVGIPFVGTTGKMLADAFQEAGISIEECYRTNVFKYHPPNNDLKLIAQTGHTIAECEPQLWAEINAIKPNVILAVGNLALKTLTGKTGILTYRGTIMMSKQGYPKVIATIHPAALFRGGQSGAMPFHNWYFIKYDIKKAVEESGFKEMKLPQRTLEVCKSDLQLANFLERYKSKTLVSVDIENFNKGCIPICIGLAFNKHHAMSVPLMNVASWLHKEGIQPRELASMWIRLGMFFARRDVKIIGQNFKFDHDKILRPLGIRIWPDALHADTALMAHDVHAEFPVNLAFLTSIYTKEPYYKDEGKEFNPESDRLEDALLYNAKDCAVTYEVYEELLECLEQLNIKDFYFGFTNKLHQAYMRIERVGFRMDFKRSRELWDKYVTMVADRQKELNDLLGYPLNPRSFQQVGVALTTDETLRFPPRASWSEDALVALLGNHAKTEKQKRVLNLIIDIRKLRLTLSTYLAAVPDFDGRMRTSYRIAGTETGRTSTSKLGPPLRPKVWIIGDKRAREIGTSFHGQTKHGDIGSDLREQYIPDDGLEFGEADLSQAEARVVAKLAGDFETLHLFETTDIHKVTATWLFGIPYEAVNKSSRFIGKTVRHAANYGMGKHRLMEEVNTNARKFHIDVSISEWKAGQILDVFHRKTPKIRGVYHPGVEDLLREQNRTLINPFGRYRQFYDRWGEELLKEAFAHLPQSTVSDHLKLAMLRIMDRLPDLQIVLEAHDAIVWQCRPEVFDSVCQVVKEELERPISFEKCSMGEGELVIPCEFKRSTKSYGDLKDYKYGLG